MIRVRIIGEDEGRVRSSGYLNLRNGSLERFEIPDNGRLSFDAHFNDARSLFVWPTNGYAQCRIELVSKEFDVVCPLLTEHFETGWRRALGIESNMTDGAGVRIAIVDMGFMPDLTLQRLRLAGPDGKSISAAEAARLAPDNRHGLDVARIIA